MTFEEAELNLMLLGFTPCTQNTSESLILRRYQKGIEEICISRHISRDPNKVEIWIWEKANWYICTFELLMAEIEYQEEKYKLT